MLNEDDSNLGLRIITLDDGELHSVYKLSQIQRVNTQTCSPPQWEAIAQREQLQACLEYKKEKDFLWGDSVISV